MVQSMFEQNQQLRLEAYLPVCAFWFVCRASLHSGFIGALRTVPIGSLSVPISNNFRLLLKVIVMKGEKKKYFFNVINFYGA